MAVSTTTIAQLTADSTVSGVEIVPIYDGAVTNPKTRRVTTAAIAALNDAAITTAQDTADAAQTTADNAIPASSIGIANGIVPLNSSTQIDAAYLSIAPTTNYKNSWNASTNSPTLADGVGTVGDAYKVGVAGTRNLGSGSISFAVGDDVILNISSVWQKFTAVAPGVASVNSLTGAVSLTTATVPASANKNYITDAENDALAASTNPSTGNPFMTQSAVNLALQGFAVTGSPFNLIQSYEINGIQSGDGTSKTLASLGFTNALAQEAFPKTTVAWGSITASTTTYDSAVLQEAIYTLGYERYTSLQSMTNRRMKINHQIVIPTHKLDVVITDRNNSQMYVVSLGGIRIDDIRTVTTGLPLFLKEPANESDAANHDLEFSWKFEDFALFAENTVGLPYANSVAFKIGAGKRLQWHNVTMANFGTGIWGSLLLNSEISNCEFQNCLTSGVKTSAGWWSGATNNTSPTQLTITRSRFKDAGLKYCDLTNSDTSRVIDTQLEGDGGDYAVYWDNLNGSVIKNIAIEGLRVEQESQFARAIVGIKAGDGFSAKLDQVFHQATVTNTTLFEAEASGGGDTRIKLTNCFNSGGLTNWKLRNIGSNCWDIDETILQGQPATEANLLNSGAYPNIWATDFSGTVPTSNRVHFQQRLPKL